jgi:hypothetical protein
MKTVLCARVLFTCLFALCASFELAAQSAPPPPMPGKQVREKVDRLMRSLQTVTGEERKQVISELYDVWASKDPGAGQAIMYFGCDLTPNADGMTSIFPKPERNEVLSKAIPALISAIEPLETKINKAWWILISLQGSCPSPQREVWEQWWKAAGSKKYDPKSPPAF